MAKAEFYNVLLIHWLKPVAIEFFSLKIKSAELLLDTPVKFFPRKLRSQLPPALAGEKKATVKWALAQSIHIENSFSFIFSF